MFGERGNRGDRLGNHGHLGQVLPGGGRAQGLDGVVLPFVRAGEHDRVGIPGAGVGGESGHRSGVEILTGVLATVVGHQGNGITHPLGETADPVRPRPVDEFGRGVGRQLQNRAAHERSTEAIVGTGHCNTCGAADLQTERCGHGLPTPLVRLRHRLTL